VNYIIPYDAIYILPSKREFFSQIVDHLFYQNGDDEPKYYEDHAYGPQKYNGDYGQDSDKCYYQDRLLIEF